ACGLTRVRLDPGLAGRHTRFMVRIGPCLALLVALACPVLCRFAPGEAMAAPGSTACAGGSPCSSCPANDPPPASEPCSQSSCFCTPYVVQEPRTHDADGADALATALAVPFSAVAPPAAAADPCGAASWRSPPGHCLVGH